VILITTHNVICKTRQTAGASFEKVGKIKGPAGWLSRVKNVVCIGYLADVCKPRNEIGKTETEQVHT